jgi:hypothetical protein
MSSFNELLSLVQRDLGADEVCVIEADDEVPVFATLLTCRLPDGRSLAVGYSTPPTDIPALERRLSMIVDSFRETLSERPEPSRPSLARLLRAELVALADRAGARDAAVIDAHSPVVWGSAVRGIDGEPTAEVIDLFRPPRRAARGKNAGAGGKKEGVFDERTTERAIARVRRLPAMATLPKGGHLAELVSDGGFGFIARSFASIYVLVVVFDEPINELRAKRAITKGLPAIERLVLALPPRDPPPVIGGRMAMRRRRR